jgi:hypothetical protein
VQEGTAVWQLHPRNTSGTPRSIPIYNHLFIWQQWAPVKTTTAPLAAYSSALLLVCLHVFWLEEHKTNGFNLLHNVAQREVSTQESSEAVLLKRM